MKIRLGILVLLICIIFFVTNLPSAASQVNKVTVIIYELHSVKTFNEGQQVNLRGQVIYHTPDKATGIPNAYYKIINQDTGKVINDGYTKHDGTFSFNWSAEYFGKRETNLKAIFPGSGNYKYGESNILTLEVFSKHPPPKPTYHSTFLSLQVQDSTSQGNIKVKPTLTYGSASKLDADVSIYVDGTYKTKIASNQWSSNIYTGSGSHTIKASVGEMISTSDSSIKYRASSDIVNYFVEIPITQPKTTYYDTQMSLQVQDGTNQGYVKVKPALTYGSASKLSADVSIYVDGTYKTKIASNQLSSNIYTGSGSHTIKASVGEMSNTFDNSIRYRASSDIVNYFVKAASIVGSGSGVTSSESFPIEYVIVGIVIAAAAGIGITLAKRKKIAPVISASPAKAQTAQTQDDTQFWVCPHCGGDTQYRNGKQYCSSCNVYL